MNTTNINRLLARLREDDGVHFCMSSFIQKVEDVGRIGPAEEITEYAVCRTALCLAGWANFLRITEDEGRDPNYFLERAQRGTAGAGLLSERNRLLRHAYGDEEQAAAWLGLDSDEATKLFYFTCSGMGRGDFDRLEPAVRRRAGINVLELLLESGSVQWGVAVSRALEA